MKWDLLKSEGASLGIFDFDLRYLDIPHNCVPLMLLENINAPAMSNIFNIVVILNVSSGPGPFPGVIDMFGTSGGLIEMRAAMLASHGFACYALPYFNYRDLPKELWMLEAEYFRVWRQSM